MGRGRGRLAVRADRHGGRALRDHHRHQPHRHSRREPFDPEVAGGTLMAATANAPFSLGILGAIYLNEYSANSRFGRLVRFMATVMTGVPSVVMGLFVFVVYTLSFGFNAFGGALALAALMLPIVIRSSEEMLKLVPDNLREASAALGTRKSRTSLTVVLPA